MHPENESDARGEVTMILEGVRNGTKAAAADLLPLVYEDLRKQARTQMAREHGPQTLQPTALVHEAWLRVAANGDFAWPNRAYFFGATSEAMRRILIEKARAKLRLKRGGGQIRVDIDGSQIAETSPDEKILLINDAMERLKLEDPEKAEVVLLKFFGGCTSEEVAEALSVTVRTVERHWAYARAWLVREIKLGQ